MYVQSFYFYLSAPKIAHQIKIALDSFVGVVRSWWSPGALMHDRDGRLAVSAWINTRLSAIFTAYCRSRVQMYVYMAVCGVRIGGFLWGYDTG